jgi:hypothetical protein
MLHNILLFEKFAIDFTYRHDEHLKPCVPRVWIFFRSYPSSIHLWFFRVRQKYLDKAGVLIYKTSLLFKSK